MELTLENILLDVSMSPVLDAGELEQAEQLLLAACQQGLAVCRVGIWLYLPAGEGIACRALLDQGHWQPVEDLVLKRNDFPNYFNALDQQRVIAACDARSDAATSEFTEPYLLPRGIFSMLDVPIRHAGAMIGIICCEETKQPKQWLPDETSFVAALADLYGRALSASQRLQYQKELEALNAELEAKVQQRTQRLEANLEQLKATQAQLVEAEKMASLGTLVAGVAHEVNTPIGVALTANSYSKELTARLVEKFKANELSRSILEKNLLEIVESQTILERNLLRADELISNFKQTAVDQVHYELQSINLHDYIQMVLVTLKPYTKEYQVDFDVHCPADVRLVTYPGAIAQVLTNLVINACVHAFSDLSIQPKILIQVDPYCDDQVLLVVQDNGHGMSEPIKKRVFEPFFTTRRGQGGSGLGLAIVYNLVTSTLQGRIQLESESGKGASFLIHLPTQLSCIKQAR
ncbi:MAG: GAF domain-containing sensor histidine kinase [Alkalimonas sp.]|nr:GAF domain-containing sensor histidine kinase [Alkalimonas sp.]